MYTHLCERLKHLNCINFFKKNCNTTNQTHRHRASLNWTKLYGFIKIHPELSATQIFSSLHHASVALSSKPQNEWETMVGLFLFFGSNTFFFRIQPLKIVTENLLKLQNKKNPSNKWKKVWQVKKSTHLMPKKYQWEKKRENRTDVC